jgi:putative pyrroloquinoline-quinone binding quinoprotein
VHGVRHRVHLRGSQDYTTFAYDAATGAKLWARRYNGPGKRADEASSLAVSPSGDAVFVTGYTTGAAGTDYATVAYDAASGARLWAKRYNGPGNGDDHASSVAVSPSGDTVYVTGTSSSATRGTDYVTIAYNTATGARLWVKRYNGPANSTDAAYSVAVSAVTGAVFVTGISYGRNRNGDYLTVAYDG